MSAKTVAVINSKGGVGKTTSVFNIAGVLSRKGEKVLVIDLDKQRNTTDTLLMNTPEEQKPPYTVFDFMLGRANAEDATSKVFFQIRGNAKPKYYNVECMAASVDLEDEKLLSKIDIDQFAKKLKLYIKEKGYTWVLVDMPPSNKVLNEICLGYMVSNVIVPLSSDMFSVSGYGDIMDTIEAARNTNPTLNILGIYLARYTRNSSMDKFIREKLSQYNTFIDIQIPNAADVRETVMFGRPISYYKRLSESRRAFENLTGEIMRRSKLN